MAANHEKLYSELRKTKEELLDKLVTNEVSAFVKPYIIEEINDIETAINKIKTGTFGMCEISGELIPGEILELIPTIKTIQEIKSMDKYYRKPMY